MTLRVVILAAGQGKRMHSDLPKVLHRLAGKPLLEHVVQTAAKLSETQPLVVFGHQGDLLRQACADFNVIWIEQKQQLGTGHAVQQTLPQLADDDRVLILYGDVPLISSKTLTTFIAETAADTVGIITAHFPDPKGLGRIIRDAHHHIIDIIEEKDATPEQRRFQEVNTGIYLLPARYLKKWLPLLQNQNAQQEFYLTDIIRLAVQEKITIHGFKVAIAEEVLGINDRLQLAQLERHYQRLQAESLMLKGVTLLDPERLDIRGELKVGRDVIIDVNVIIEGHVTLGNNCVIGSNTVIRNACIGNHVEIKSNSVIDGAEIADHCIIGPFARIRPGTVLASHVHIGNFVEIKNSIVDLNSKINHLSYVGDSEVGKKVNIGAGTITCNYDGVNKHRTVIQDNALIGSNTQLVAPLTIGEGAFIGAGSTITRDAPAHQLTLSRAQQRSIENWQRPKKQEA